eukprot:1187202-Prorocentrum_minimum.AAC.5
MRRGARQRGRRGGSRRPDRLRRRKLDGPRRLARTPWRPCGGARSFRPSDLSAQHLHLDPLAPAGSFRPSDRRLRSRRPSDRSRRGAARGGGRTTRRAPAAETEVEGGPIRRRKRRYILTTGQSEAGSVGIFSRQPNRTQEAHLESRGRREVPVQQREHDLSQHRPVHGQRPVQIVASIFAYDGGGPR